MTAELIPYTFKDTGRTVMIRKISPYLINELRKVYPPPEPPMQEVDYDGEKIVEPNPAHPDYPKMMADYNTMIEQKMRRLIIKRGVVVNFTPEIEQEIEELREFWASETEGHQIEETDDAVFYVTYLCFGSDTDTEELIDAIMRRSQPTREDVELTKAAFRG